MNNEAAHTTPIETALFIPSMIGIALLLAFIVHRSWTTRKTRKAGSVVERTASGLDRAVLASFFVLFYFSINLSGAPKGAALGAGVIAGTFALLYFGAVFRERRQARGSQPKRRTEESLDDSRSRQ